MLSLKQQPETWDISAQNSTLQLLTLAQQGDTSAKELLTKQNLPLVKSIVKRFSYYGNEWDDLIQVGSIGLIKAIDRFDLSMNTAFSTYAVPLILGEIKHYLRKNRGTAVSRQMLKQAIFIEKTRNKLSNTQGREPDLSQLAKACNLSPEQILLSRGLQTVPIPLSQLTDSGKEDAYPEDRMAFLVSDESETITERLNISQMLLELPPKLAYIIKGRYFEEKSQCVLAKELDISQVQVSRLEKKALELIKRKMSENQPLA